MGSKKKTCQVHIGFLNLQDDVVRLTGLCI
jgi:hypothetical protein